MVARLTILTDPIPTGRYFFPEYTKRIARPAYRFFFPGKKGFFPKSITRKYRGHFAVTRSVVEGLEKIGVPANYNPRSIKAVAPIVVVLSRTSVLEQVLGLKKKGRIKRIVAGPNILVFPSDRKELITNPGLDTIIMHDEYTRKMFIEDCPELAGRCELWPAGVDTDYWKPDPNKKKSKILVYDKYNKGPTTAIEDYIELLQAWEHEVVLIRYGDYSFSQYRDHLQHATLMVGFSQQENQGLFWAEAWAMDVPTLVWDNDWYTLGHKTWRVSPCPYLTEETGLFFKDIDEFKKVYAYWEGNRAQFQPRKWLLDNMSDEVAARRLCSIAGVPVS